MNDPIQTYEEYERLLMEEYAKRRREEPALYYYGVPMIRTPAGLSPALEPKEPESDNYKPSKLPDSEHRTPVDDESGYIGFVQGCILMGRRGWTKEDASFRILFAVKAARIAVELSLPKTETVEAPLSGVDRMRRLFGL